MAYITLFYITGPLPPADRVGGAQRAARHVADDGELLHIRIHVHTTDNN